MAVISHDSTVRLALSQDSQGPARPARWLGHLVALGGLPERYAEEAPSRQLIVAISLPRRDYAAALLACGWVLNKRAPRLDSPLRVLRDLRPQTPVRLVTEHFVVADWFKHLDERGDNRVQLRGSQWMVSKVVAVATLPDLAEPLRSDRPPVGTLGRWANIDSSWSERLASPQADLAIIGTLKWLEEDLGAVVSVLDDSDSDELPLQSGEGTIADLVLPYNRSSATWFTRLYAASRIADQLPLPGDLKAVILDGAGAIKYLTEIEAPIVVCIVDRSIADETAAEMIVQLRNSRGEPVSLQDRFGWRAYAGMEALAFTVPM